jgi:sugar phosphate permease
MGLVADTTTSDSTTVLPRRILLLRRANRVAWRKFRDLGKSVLELTTNVYLSGWRWIFIMQGLITCVLALGSYFLIVDFPEQAANAGFQLKFINEEESAFIVARIEKDRHDAIPEPFRVGSYLKNALDLKVWGFACLFMLTTTCTYAIAYFLPIILNDGMGFSVAASECLVSPPYVAAAIVMYTLAYLGDKYHIRAPFILINGVLLLIGKAWISPFPNTNIVTNF